MPNFVSLGRIQVKYNLPLTEAVTGATGNNGTGTGYESWEMMYRLDTNPVGLLSVPWVDFLDYTCRWAYGSVGAADVKTNMTFGMHYSRRSPAHRVAYDYKQSQLYMVQISPGVYAFNCKRFVEDMNAAPYQYLDCNEFGTVLCQAMASQGVSAETLAHFFYKTTANGLTYPGFHTNLLCPAGQSSTDPSKYRTYDFSHHTVTGIAATRFDASSSYWFQLNGSGYQNPVAGWSMPDFFYNPPSKGLVDYPFEVPDGITLISRTSTVIM